LLPKSAEYAGIQTSRRFLIAVEPDDVSVTPAAFAGVDTPSAVTAATITAPALIAKLLLIFDIEFLS
jgi:hypothetical protein